MIPYNAIPIIPSQLTLKKYLYAYTRLKYFILGHSLGFLVELNSRDLLHTYMQPSGGWMCPN